MNWNTTGILELYVRGKDQDQFSILEEIYAEDAVVEFKIDSDSISFPEKIVGNKEIALVLSKDFNQKYKNVKTYYLSRPVDDSSNIHNQNWLVVMSDIASGKTRVGTGCYDWEFERYSKRLKISKQKIYIHAMLEISDENSRELQKIQQTLDYPWTLKQNVLSTLPPDRGLEEVVAYLR